MIVAFLYKDANVIAAFLGNFILEVWHVITAFLVTSFGKAVLVIGAFLGNFIWERLYLRLRPFLATSFGKDLLVIDVFLGNCIREACTCDCGLSW